MENKNRLFLYLVLISTLTLLPFLGLTDFNTKGEPREAIVSYAMLETGNWTLPVNNGGDIAYKPPFFHWCIAAFSSVTGKVTEYTSRMPSALALIFMVWGGFLFFAKRRGSQVAFLTALITLSNFEIHRAGMNCRVDMVLTACIVLALYQLFRWCESGLKGFPWIAVVLMGCGTLTKGPVGFILPCLVTGVYMLLRGVKFSKAFGSMVGVGVAACILPALWYITAYQQGGDNFVALVMEENFGRFMGKMSYASHENPAHYNVMTVLTGFAPYTLLVLISLFALKYTRIQVKPRDGWKRFVTYIRHMDDARLFSLLSIVLIFVFYCIPKSKRSVYLMPIYPFIAYFLAEYILYLVRKAPKVIKLYGGFLAIAGLLLVTVFAAVKAGIVPETLFKGRHAAENIAYLHALRAVPFTLINIVWVLLPMGAAFFFFGSLKKKSTRLVYATLGVTFALFLSLDGVYQPTVLNAKSDKSMANDIMEFVPQGKVYSHTEVDMLRFFVVNFYMEDRVALFEKEKPETGYLLIGERDFEQFKPRHEDTYAFEQVYKSMKRGNDIRDIIYLYRFDKK